jgi:hypothetical protein
MQIVAEHHRTDAAKAKITGRHEETINPVHDYPVRALVDVIQTKQYGIEENGYPSPGWTGAEFPQAGQNKSPEQFLADTGGAEDPWPNPQGK